MKASQKTILTNALFIDNFFFLIVLFVCFDRLFLPQIFLVTLGGRKPFSLSFKYMYTISRPVMLVSQICELKHNVSNMLDYSIGINRVNGTWIIASFYTWTE